MRIKEVPVVRPLINEELISANIQSVHEHGSAITVAPVIETVMLADDDKVYKSVERSKCNMAKAPQSFFLKDIFSHNLSKKIIIL